LICFFYLSLGTFWRLPIFIRRCFYFSQKNRKWNRKWLRDRKQYLIDSVLSRQAQAPGNSHPFSSRNNGQTPEFRSWDKLTLSEKKYEDVFPANILLTWSKGSQKLTVESDSAIVIDLITKNKININRNYSLIMKARDLLAREWEVYRKANFIADCVAKFMGNFVFLMTHLRIFLPL
jgi:hypothetical protein